MAKASFVITISGAAADEGVVELDPDHAGNLDESGNLKSTFKTSQADPIFIVNLPSDMKIESVKVRPGCGGATVEPGIVTRSKSDELSFTDADPTADLSYYPINKPKIELYTVPAALLKFIWKDKQITADNEALPVIGIATYKAECKQITYTPPAGLSLADDQDFFKILIDVKTIND